MGYPARRGVQEAVPVRPGDALVVFDIDGLPVRLILPERDIDLVALPYRTNLILAEGRDRRVAR